ncbi:MAG: radical SAM protein [Anaerolineales bacterium]|nr:radical SAM protein [Anaerolineales bacterium]
MQAIDRLKLLNQQMQFEPDTDVSPDGRATLPVACLEQRADDLYVHPAVMPNGRHIRLLKTQLTSVCERDCHYCPFRSGRDFRRATFQPEEFARLFMELHRRNIAEGLFVSSGLAGGGVRTQDRLLQTAEILRHKLNYRGYLHLKIMPGAEKAQVERAMQLADRVSLNLEAPNTPRLARLAPHKTFQEELLTRLRWVEEIRRTQPGHRGWNGHWPSSTTQFVAGGADESDLELLQTTEYLYRSLRLKRTYFMAFNPIPDTPLEDHAPTPANRERRLYQASFLLRDYGFSLEEMPFEAGGMLPLLQDPKLAWAELNLSAQPVEVNRADRAQLLRVPGIGPRGVDAILRLRQQATIRDLSTLKSAGILAERAAPYLLLDGKKPIYQISLGI